MATWTTESIPDLTGRTAVVTGANSGLGFWTTVGLARKGARVIMACRDAGRAQAALERVHREAPESQVELMSLDLQSLASVEEAAAEVAARTPALDLLVNNAGIMAPPRALTSDGFESQIGTNHLGHFALTGRLVPTLLAAPAPRVVVVSSSAHKPGRIDFDDLMGEQRYRPWGAYSQSKLANLLFMAELDRRARAAGLPLTAVAAHPGYASTHLQAGEGLRGMVMRLGNSLLAQSDAAGALPSLYAATAPDVSGGEYFGPDRLFEMRGAPTRVGRTRAAQDTAVAARLWAVSEELTGVSYDALAPA
jgi:NAD(P)-dependent dehydrogenase (short-subunit alcohol dehydrogenase family)